MINYRGQMRELGECKSEFDVLGKRLFDLNSEVTESDFSTQEMFALGGRIIYIRKRVADVIADIQDKLEENGMGEEESSDLMEVLYQEFDRDDSIMGALVEDIAVLKKNNLAISIIGRYEDMILNIIQYCRTGKTSFLKRKFKDVSVQDMLS